MSRKCARPRSRRRTSAGRSASTRSRVVPDTRSAPREPRCRCGQPDEKRGLGSHRRRRPPPRRCGCRSALARDAIRPGVSCDRALNQRRGPSCVRPRSGTRRRSRRPGCRPRRPRLMKCVAKQASVVVGQVAVPGRTQAITSRVEPSTSVNRNVTVPVGRSIARLGQSNTLASRRQPNGTDGAFLKSGVLLGVLPRCEEGAVRRILATCPTELRPPSKRRLVPR